MTSEQTQVAGQTAVAAPAASKEAEKPKAGKTKRKVVIKQTPRANAYIQATYNNTLITVTDPNGNVLCWSSAGKVGFKGPKKATPYAASLVVKDLANKLNEAGVREVSVFVKGIGGGREGAIRGFHTNGLAVVSISDTTPIPHNGCRPPKRRRV